MPPRSTHSVASQQIRAARAGLTGVFFINGASFGSWASRIPAVKEQVGSGTGALGLSLLGIALGALLSKPVSGQLVARKGSGPVTRWGITLSCLALLPPAFAREPLELGLALVGFGMALGMVDVAMNSHGVAIERQLGRPVLSSLHASFSAGALAGALSGGLFAAHHTRPWHHFALVSVALGAAALWAARRLLPASLDVAAERERDRLWIRIPEGRRLSLSLLALAGFCGMAAEGATADWGALYLHDDLGLSAGFASLAYALFSVTMAAGRLAGDRVVARWGGARVVIQSAAWAGAVFGLALMTGSPVLVLLGFTGLGIGLAVVMPVTFSLAGTVGGRRAGPAITYVSSISGTGLLAGPPLIGFLTEAVGLRAALSTVTLLSFAAAGLMYAITARPARPLLTVPRPTQPR